MSNTPEIIKCRKVGPYIEVWFNAHGHTYQLGLFEQEGEGPKLAKELRMVADTLDPPSGATVPADHTAKAITND